MNDRAHRICAALLAAAALVGCARTGTLRAGPPHVLRIAYAGDPASLVPFIAIDQEVLAIDTLFCQTLVGLSADNRDVPILVTRIPSRENGDVSPDGKQITYHLRRDVRFADGVALTSADVAFTYRAIFDPRNRATSVVPYQRIVSLRTPDAYTVVIRLREPWNAAVRVLFAQADYVYCILPKHAFTGTKVVGSVVGERAVRQRPLPREDVAARRPNRSRTKSVLPAESEARSDRAAHRAEPQLELRRAPLGRRRRRHADAGERRARRNAPPAYASLRFPENATRLLYLQTQRTPTSDVRVRRAIAETLDYSALSAAWRNVFTPATSFLAPPVVRWKSVAIPAYPHDPAAAARELDAAGWRLRNGVRFKDGVPLGGIIGANSEDPINVRIATLVQAQLAASGMIFSIKANPVRIWFSPDGLLRNGKASISGETWVGGSDPEQSLNLRCVQAVSGDENHSFYCSRRFESLFDDQAATPSRTQRDRDFDAMQVLVHDDVPVIPLYYEDRLIGVEQPRHRIPAQHAVASGRRGELGRALAPRRKILTLS